MVYIKKAKTIILNLFIEQNRADNEMGIVLPYKLIKK